MRKKVNVILVLVLCIFCVLGCTGKKSDYAEKDGYFTNFPSELKDGEYIICVYENNQEIIKNITMSAGFDFYIISKEKLNEEDVSIEIDTANKYSLIQNDCKNNNGIFEKNVCLMYNDFDWENLKKMEMSSDEDDLQKFDKISSDIDQQYSKLKEGQFPNYFCKKYKVQFDINNKFNTEDINSMLVKIKGKEYETNIGKINFRIIDESDYESPEICSFDEVGRMDYNIVQNSDGLIELSNYRLCVGQDVVIKEIKLINTDKEIKLQEVHLTTEVDGMLIDQQWNPGTEIEVNKNDELSINFIVADKSFVNKETYGVNIYPEIVYEYKGKMYTTYTQALCCTKYDNQTLYAIYKDEIDTSNYYYKYVEYFN